MHLLVHHLYKLSGTFPNANCLHKLPSSCVPLQITHLAINCVFHATTQAHAVMISIVYPARFTLRSIIIISIHTYIHHSNTCCAMLSIDIDFSCVHNSAAILVASASSSSENNTQNTPPHICMHSILQSNRCFHMWRRFHQIHTHTHTHILLGVKI